MPTSKPIKFVKRQKPNSDFCCVPFCAMSGKFNSSVSFHHFPTNNHLKNTWIRSIKRDDFTVKKHTLVCGRHFLSTDIIPGFRRRLREGAVPVLFPWNNFSLSVSKHRLWQRLKQPKLQEPIEMNGNRVKQCQDNDSSPEPDASGFTDAKKEQHQPMEELKVRLEDKALQQTFALQRFCGSDDDIRFYTRFASYHHLLAFWKWIEPATDHVHDETISAAGTALQHSRQSCHLALIDEFFLFLMYLSLGLTEHDLGERFSIHHCTVSHIINTWINFLYTLLSAVEIWMCPEYIKKTMPEMFGPYSDTQVIVDCTKLLCEVPSSSLCKFSTYTTLKAMVGVSPHGAITFVSCLYSGSISDGDLLKASGIIRLLDHDMAVMVDEAFKIDEIVPCKIYKPPFVHEKPQLSDSQDNTCLRIHIENIISLVKNNKVFQSVIPLTIAGNINQLFTVACRLCNYQNQPLHFTEK